MGRDVLHCPYCHGWEVRDQPIGILATSPISVHQTLLFRQWTDRLTLLLHTGPRPTDEQAEQLTARDIAIVEGEVSHVEIDWTVLINETRPRTAPAPAGTHHAHDTVLRAQRVR